MAVALVLSTAWLSRLRWQRHGRGSTLPTIRDAEQAVARSASGDVDARRRSSRVGEASFFDRLLGDRTREVTVPSGTTVMLRWSETVSSRGSAPGDAFRTTVDEDVTVDRRGRDPRRLRGRGPGDRGSSARRWAGGPGFGLEFTAVELPSGESEPIDAVFSASGKGQNLKDAGIIAGSTVGGAILGEAVHEGEGGVIGGILGGIGGAVAAVQEQGQAGRGPRRDGDGDRAGAAGDARGSRLIQT